VIGSDRLFDCIPVAGYILPSRIVLAPINTGFAKRGQPTDRLLQFHKNRAGPEIGIGMVGNVALSDESVTNVGTLALRCTGDIPKFAALARCILEKGSLPGIQLGFSPPFLSPPTNWVAKDRSGELKRLQAIVTAFPDAYVASVLKDFTLSATLAAQAGFEVIQLHAAHGYFLSLLLNPLTNRRNGEFRAAGEWLSRFIDGLRDATNPRLVSVRLSLTSGLRENDSEEIWFTREISKQLARAGTHILDFSNGFYTVDRRLIYPGIEKGVLPNFQAVRNLAADLDCVISLAGNVTDPRDVPELSDRMIISVGRALIADPHFARKARLGEFAAIVKCKRTGHCHYFSRRKDHIECGVNQEFVRIN